MVEANGIYLNNTLIKAKNLNPKEVQDRVTEYVLELQGVYDAIPAHQLRYQTHTQGFWGLVQRGYYHKRSPDISIILKSGWLDKTWGDRGGTNHGTPFNYDTHVPLLWYGWKVPKGKSTIRRVQIVDIAPSVCSFLHIQFPSGSYGEPIQELFKVD